MEFFRDLCADRGLTMETAGMLKGGAIYWALCRTALNGDIAGDKHNGYVLVSTSADGSMATVAKLTSVRVVCNNTLDVALKRSGGAEIKTRHNTSFDADKVKRDLGLIDFEESWEGFRETMSNLATKPVSDATAKEFFTTLLSPPKKDLDKLFGITDAVNKAKKERKIRGLDSLLDCYYTAPGARPGSAYGLVQGVTRYLDHARGKDAEKRLASSWFGQGHNLKEKALELATKI